MIETAENLAQTLTDAPDSGGRITPLLPSAPTATCNPGWPGASMAGTSPVSGSYRQRRSVRHSARSTHGPVAGACISAAGAAAGS